jgi:hypothetical protein
MMKEAMRSDRSDVSDVEHLIVPISAFFGPVYRPVGSARELRKSWSSSVTVGILAVAFLFFTVALVVGIGAGGANDPAYLFERPVVFWSLIFGVVVARWLVGVGWLVRHRSKLERVPPGLTLDARLAADCGPASLAALRFDAWSSALVTLAFLVPAMMQMDVYPWIFGPMAFMFAARSWTTFRVLRFRRRHALRARSSDQSTASAP